jgi:hypothetical protein
MNTESDSSNRRWKIMAITGVSLVVAALIGVLIFFESGAKLGRKSASTPEFSEELKAAKKELKEIYSDRDDIQSDETTTGVTRHNRAESLAGYNIFTNGADQVFIMDMDGHTVHSWNLPGKKFCRYAELLSTGDIVVICDSQSIIKLNWSGEVQWEFVGMVHHDVAFLPDGSMLLPVAERPKNYKELPRVSFDAVLHLTPLGKPRAIWSTYKNLERLQESHPPLTLDSLMSTLDEEAKKNIFNYYDLNAIEVLPDTPLGQMDQRFQAGNIMLSLKNANVITIMNKDTMELVWSWGPGELDFQHMPTMIGNGNILVFDNGTHRDYTRILEIEPLSREIVWQYQTDIPSDFFSKSGGSVQRLPNENTLICESDNGRCFEISLTEDIVWEYQNPEVSDGKSNPIYRMMRIPEEVVDHFLESQPAADG